MTLTKQEAIGIKSYRDKAVVSSLRIAELTSKTHPHVLRDIREMLQQIDSTYGQFTLKYTSGASKSSYDYMVLPKRELDLLLTGYSIPYRKKLLDELEEHRQALLEKPFMDDVETVGFDRDEDRLNKSLNIEQEDTQMGDKLKAIMQMADIIKSNQSQSQQIIDMIKDMDETKTSDTIIMSADNRLLDFIDKGSIKTIIKIKGN